MEIKDLISNKGKVLNGPKIIRPTTFNDERGYFYESWNQSTLELTSYRIIILVLSEV